MHLGRIKFHEKPGANNSWRVDQRKTVDDNSFIYVRRRNFFFLCKLIVRKILIFYILGRVKMMFLLLTYFRGFKMRYTL